MKIRCRVGLHNWAMWSEPKEEAWGYFESGTGAKVSDYVKLTQTRRCQDCRFIERLELVRGK